LWGASRILSVLSIRESFYLVSPCFLHLIATPSLRPLYVLGYLPAHNRVYLADKDMQLYAYTLSLSVVEYQTAVLRGDMDAAAEILESVPKSEVNKVARFLEQRGTSCLYSSIPLILAQSI
jgi:hypothetical protein